MNTKIKMLYAGQPCRKCNTPVILQKHKAKWKPDKNQEYYYTAWLRCTSCNTIYLIDSMKVYQTKKIVIDILDNNWYI